MIEKIAPVEAPPHGHSLFKGYPRERHRGGVPIRSEQNTAVRGNATAAVRAAV